MLEPSVFDFGPDGIVVRRGGSKRLCIYPEPANDSAEPVVKWAGGKQWLARAARLLAPKDWQGRYYEACVGGGSFFFALSPRKATLADRNDELISTYRALSNNAEAVIRHLRTYPYEEDFFYDMRSKQPRSVATAAARFLYLNRTCYNGLYRVNKKGEFNTPFGRYQNPTVCDSGRLRRAGESLARATLATSDFGAVVKRARAGDFVYFDPPYITGHQNNGFLKYNSRLFTWADQQRLAKCALGLAARGVHVLVSNADYPSVIELYAGLHFTRVYRRSAIAGTTASRGDTSEALFSSYRLSLSAPKES